MKRFAAFAILLALPIALGTAPSNARVASVKSGYCYVGTCSIPGTRFAANVKNCKKDHCPAGLKDAAR